MGAQRGTSRQNGKRTIAEPLAVTAAMQVSGRRSGRQDGRCAPSAFHGRPRTGRAGRVFRLDVRR